MAMTDVLGAVPDSFWERAASARRRLLMLDYDGTIAPFRAERQEAVPLPRTLGAVRLLAHSAFTNLAIVSGRPVSELAMLLPDVRAHLVGVHGWEERTAEGRLTCHDLPQAAGAALDRAEEQARAAGLGERLERKRGALVLHTRGLPEETARALLEASSSLWRATAARENLRLVPTHGGLEIRVPGRDKGTAVRDLLAKTPQGTLPVYLGDDQTDEDAFEVLRGIGYGFRIGPAESRTRAAAALPTTESVADFLERWLDRVEQAASVKGGDPWED